MKLIFTNFSIVPKTNNILLAHTYFLANSDCFFFSPFEITFFNSVSLKFRHALNLTSLFRLAPFLT